MVVMVVIIRRVCFMELFLWVKNENVMDLILLIWIFVKCGFIVFCWVLLVFYWRVWCFFWLWVLFWLFGIIFGLVWLLICCGGGCCCFFLGLWFGGFGLMLLVILSVSRWRRWIRKSRSGLISSVRFWVLRVSGVCGRCWW